MSAHRFLHEFPPVAYQERNLVQDFFDIGTKSLFSVRPCLSCCWSPVAVSRSVLSMGPGCGGACPVAVELMPVHNFHLSHLGDRWQHVHDQIDRRRHDHGSNRSCSAHQDEMTKYFGSCGDAILSASKISSACDDALEELAEPHDAGLCVDGAGSIRSCRVHPAFCLLTLFPPP